MTLLLEKAGIGHWVTGQKRKTKRGNFSKFIPIDCDAFNAYHDLPSSTPFTDMREPVWRVPL